jgi:hypothetical protein
MFIPNQDQLNLNKSSQNAVGEDSPSNSSEENNISDGVESSLSSVIVPFST